MTPSKIARHRLESQKIVGRKFTEPSEVVAWLGAIQAQDYAGAKWSIGLRLRRATDGDVEHAIRSKAIVRSWLMRGTLHFAAAEDIRWILELVAPRIIAGSAGRHRQLELEEAVFTRSKKLFDRALRDRGRLTRDEMYAVLENAGIPTAGQRGYHILWRTALEGLICFGPPHERRQTFVLLDEWAPSAKRMDLDRALAELAKRYFASRGPATLQDFVWWSGLKVVDARAGLEAVASQLMSEKADGQTYWLPRKMPVRKDRSPTACLLPGFDEYLLGYRNRAAVLDVRHSQKVCFGGNGMFRPTIVINGRIVGTWSRTRNRAGTEVRLQPFGTFTEAEKRAAVEAICHYGKFLGMPVAGSGAQNRR